MEQWIPNAPGEEAILQQRIGKAQTNKGEQASGGYVFVATIHKIGLFLVSHDWQNCQCRE